jgi:hypothetical protein
MTGEIITAGHRTYRLPALLAWNIVRTGGVPCDSFSVTCVYTADMSGPLHLAEGFAALDGGDVFWRGIVDEYVLCQSDAGRTVTITGRGYAARLLDNESRPLTYQAATLEEILRNHVTPYGITCAQHASIYAGSVYSVAAGSSQWKALEGFCRTWGGFTPRFDRLGRLLAAPEGTGTARRVTESTPLLSLTKRENHYGVLSEVLVIDKTRSVSYSVKNQEFLNRGGQCRHVIYTPGQSTWSAMRYTGEYQIARSREREAELELLLPGAVAADPGDSIVLSRPECGQAGTYRVAEVENALGSTGETTLLTLRKRG